MFKPFTVAVTVNVNFPALDRLVTYLEGEQQKQIDALTAEVQKVTQSLKQPTTDLQASVDQAT